MHLFFLFTFTSALANAELPLTVPPPSSPKISCPKLDVIKAVKYGDLNCVKTAIAQMDVNDVDREGDSALHWAAKIGKKDVVAFLITQGADIRLLNFDAQTPQIVAEMSLQWDIARHLSETEWETQRLDQAIEQADIAAVKASLSRGASIGTRKIRLDTSLHRAVQSNLVDIAALLLKAGAKIDQRNHLGETALHMAAMRGFSEAIEFLLKNGANPNALDERRNTPLDFLIIHAQDTKSLALMKEYKARRGFAAGVGVELTGGAGGSAEN